MVGVTVPIVMIAIFVYVGVTRREMVQEKIAAGKKWQSSLFNRGGGLEKPKKGPSNEKTLEAVSEKVPRFSTVQTDQPFRSTN